MEILKRKNGEQSYRAKVYINGKPLYETFRRKTDADAWKRRVIADRDRSIALGVTPKKEIRFSDFGEIWNERRLTSMAPSSQVRFKALLRMYLLPHLERYMLREITREIVIDHVGILRKENTPLSTIDGTISLLGMMLNNALEWNYISVNPASRIPKVGQRLSRQLYWDASEVSQFLLASRSDPNYALYATAVNTGMRRGELCGLRWSAVDFKNGNLEISHIRDRFGGRDTTKTKKRRVIPMTMEVRRILLEYKKSRIASADHDYVFCRPDGAPINPQHFYRVFGAAQRRAGMSKRITFHDLRHTAASNCAMTGIGREVVQELLGHSSLHMTGRYSHLSQSHLRKELERLRYGSEEAGNSPYLVHENKAE